MKTPAEKIIVHKKSASKRIAGFSLVELMVAMAVFLVVGGAAVALVKKHVPLFTQQQAQSSINLALRNAAAQMQIDVVNAGTGYYPADNIPSWPIGVTITNRNGGGCFDPATKTYTANCFDTLNVIGFDTSISAAHPTADCSPGVLDTDSQAVITITPADATSTPASLAAAIPAGTELLIVKNDGSQLTTVDVSAPATAAGTVVSVPIVNTVGYPDAVNGPFFGINNHDNLGLSNPITSSLANPGDLGVGPIIGNQFCSSDWVLKLAPITYGVDTSDPTDPKLYRQVAGGARDVLAEQIVGFKVGASLQTAPKDPNCHYSYNYQSNLPTAAPSCGYNGDWASIASVRISIIGRTSNTNDVNLNFQNTFDQGNYKVEGVSIVVNPRNLTMNN